VEPRVSEKFSYGVPYYKRNRQLCFIWPSSSPPGPNDGSVSFGLCYGNKLSNDEGLLLSEGRKQVYVIRFKTLSEINVLENSLKQIIMEALLVDSLKNVPVKKRKS
jgi:hypothetical protein